MAGPFERDNSLKPKSLEQIDERISLIKENNEKNTYRKQTAEEKE